MIKKILNIRLWPDPADEKRTWASGVVQNGYEVLYVSQFTLVRKKVKDAWIACTRSELPIQVAGSCGVE